MPVWKEATSEAEDGQESVLVPCTREVSEQCDRGLTLWCEQVKHFKPVTCRGNGATSRNMIRSENSSNSLWSLTENMAVVVLLLSLCGGKRLSISAGVKQ